MGRDGAGVVPHPLEEAPTLAAAAAASARTRADRAAYEDDPALPPVAAAAAGGGALCEAYDCAERLAYDVVVGGAVAFE